MGTNYYVRLKPACPTCKRPFEEIHLGKSSGGWKFSLQLNGKRFWHDKTAMKKWTKRKAIFDEYGERISWADFWKLVEAKQAELHPTPEEIAKYSYHYIIIKKYIFHDCQFS